MALLVHSVQGVSNYFKVSGWKRRMQSLKWKLLSSSFDRYGSLLCKMRLVVNLPIISVSKQIFLLLGTNKTDPITTLLCIIGGVVYIHHRISVLRIIQSLHCLIREHELPLWTRSSSRYNVCFIARLSLNSLVEISLLSFFKNSRRRPNILPRNTELLSV